MKFDTHKHNFSSITQEEPIGGQEGVLGQKSKKTKVGVIGLSGKSSVQSISCNPVWLDQQSEIQHEE